MSIDINDIYGEYLAYRNQARSAEAEHEGSTWFQISSAGLCARKHFFKATGIVPAPPDATSLKVMRLGTLVHEDIQEALRWYQEQQKGESVLFLIEQKVEIPEYNCRGYLDVFVIPDGSLKDIKTIHSYKWKMLFGRSKDPAPSINAQIQTGTYGIWLIDKYDLKDLKIIYYKKDSSDIKEVSIDIKFIEAAREYWEKTNALVSKGLPSLCLGEAPVYSWECSPKYCGWFAQCKGGLRPDLLK